MFGQQIFILLQQIGDIICIYFFTQISNIQKEILPQLINYYTKVPKQIIPKYKINQLQTNKQIDSLTKMTSQMLSSVTTYLADLTTKLTHIVKEQHNNSFSSSFLTNEHFTSTTNHNPKYKKLQHWNYLQYLDHMLKLDTTHAIKLQKINQPFTLKQDLIILKTISSSPNKIIVKSLEELSLSKQVYKNNFRNVLLKRPFKQLKLRHQFLSTCIQEPQLKYIISWLQLNGLDTKAYIKVSTLQEFQKTHSRISVSKSYLPGGQQIVSTLIQLTKENKINKSEEIQSETQDKSLDNLLDKKLSPKKAHQSISPTIDISTFDINRIFQTPPVKIIPQIDPFKAPKKIKQEDNQDDIIPQTTKKPRKIVRVIDVKKDIVIKQESEQHKIIQTPKRNLPIVSEFKLFDDQEESKLNRQKRKQKGKQKEVQQNMTELKAIVQRFKTNQKLSQVRILKILSDVSGDLTDLKSYLKTQERKLLWKRLQDAVLRNHIKNAGKRAPVSSKRQLAVDLLYEKLVNDKGEQRVRRRIRYLGLYDNNQQ